MATLLRAARPLVARRVRGMATSAAGNGKSGYQNSPSYVSMPEYLRMSAPVYVATVVVFAITSATGDNKKETTMGDAWLSANSQYRRFCDMDPMGMNGTAAYTPSYMK